MAMKISTGCRIGAAFLALAVVFAALWALADVPHQMSYQGFLRDSDGEPVSGTVNLQFFVFPDSASPVGEECWGPEDWFNHQITDGFFELQLGQHLPLNPECFDGTVQWLEIRVNGAPLSPRKPISSAAYAIKPAGEPGATGPTGPPGPAGATGATGPTGPATGFGTWVPAVVGMSTQATTDGIVTVYGGWNSGAISLSIKTDSDDPPATVRVKRYEDFAGVTSNEVYSVACPVRKNDYYLIESSGMTTLTAYFLSIGQ
jgi:hypothetical protein